MSKCGECRFMTMRAGCRAGVCQEVRAEMRGQGMTNPFRPLIQLRPEPVTLGGLCGYRIDYTGRWMEWAPTPEGRKAAWGMIDYLISIGVEAKYTELRHDAETQRFLKSVNL